MPVLIAEIKQDLAGNPLVREFAVSPHKGVQFYHGGTTRFEYYASEHNELVQQVAILENNGYVRDVRVYQDAPIYRMTEEFVELVRTS